MNIFVTGATGFLGTHLIKRLEQEGHNIKALSRTPQEEAHFVVGDVVEDDISPLMNGCDVLIHAAGLVSHKMEDADLLWKIHVEGTQRTFAAAEKAGITRVIYLSTSGTIAVSKSPKEISEDHGAPFHLIKEWPYYRSKLFAEQLAMKQHTFDVICLNPSLLLGPGDRPEGESTRSIRLFLDDQMPMAPSGGMAYVDVRDVVEGTVAALTKGRSGERYLLNGCNTSFLEFYQRLARISGKSAPIAAMPTQTRSLLNLFPKWKDIGAPLGLDIGREELLLASHYWYCDCSKAEQDLGWTPRDPLETLEDTVFDIQENQQMFDPWA